jgi:hypothetical protein
LALQLQFALSPFGVNEGLNTPNAISPATATFNNVSMVEKDQVSALQLHLASSALGVNDGFKTPNAINPATATFSNVSIVFSLGAGVLPLPLLGAKLLSPLLGPTQIEP